MIFFFINKFSVYENNNKNNILLWHFLFCNHHRHYSKAGIFALHFFVVCALNSIFAEKWIKSDTVLYITARTH